MGKFYVRLFVSSSKSCIKTVDEVASVLRVKHLEMDNTTTRLVLLGGGGIQNSGCRKKPDSGEEGGDLPALIGW